MRVVFVWLACGVVFLLESGSAAKLTVNEKIRDDPDLSQFYALMETNEMMRTSLRYRQATVFAPTNQAFQRFTNKTDVLYHITNLAQTLEQLQQSITTEMEGNPPLWVTKVHRKYSDDIYINNAKIIKTRSDYQAPNNLTKNQVLHVIDEVLVPVLTNPGAGTAVYNPDAYTFLNQAESLELGPHRVRSFRQRVAHTRKEEVFKAEGRHTFFIPVEEGFKPAPRPEKIDGRVIDGHVIPNQVLFTNPTPHDVQYETLAFGDNVKVTVSFGLQNDGKNSYPFVRSNTLIGDSNLAQGVVLAQIVKANIPVRNGVVHLIHRPLMIVDTNVTAFLQSFKDREDSPLYKFYSILLDVGADFIDTINHKRDLTLFAPSNAAWEDPSLQSIIQDKNRLRDILNLHLVVNQRLPLDKIKKENKITVQTASPGKSLYFNIITSGTNETLTVEGGGVNATVIEPNIAATNGIVHIIDRVLGVPYTTVYEKLKTDPMLNDTFILGEAGGFNKRLADKTKKYTYFVPRDKAWQKAEIEFPSTYKKLFMKEYAYHAQSILERHLMVSDTPFTMAKIKLMANDSHEVVLPTLRDTLKIRVKETDKSFYVEWQNEWIQVFRPDVECINGIIHVIDKPFLTDSDVQVTGTAANLFPFSILSQLTFITVLKWLML